MAPQAHTRLDPLLRRAGAWLLVAAGLGAVAPALAQPPVPHRPARGIEVTGRAEVAAPPEIATLHLAVETRGEDAAAAAAENARLSERVLAAVRERLGERGTASTSGYVLHPQYHHPERGGEPTITGYVARNEVRVETRDLDGVGELIDAAIAAGANQVSNLSFGLDEGSPREGEALAAAARDARAQAEALAASLGVRLGRVLEASTAAERPPVPVAYARMEAMAVDAPSTPVEPGEVTVRAEVRVRWEIAE